MFHRHGRGESPPSETPRLPQLPQLPRELPRDCRDCRASRGPRAAKRGILWSSGRTWAPHDETLPRDQVACAGDKEHFKRIQKCWRRIECWVLFTLSPNIPDTFSNFHPWPSEVRFKQHSQAALCLCHHRGSTWTDTTRRDHIGAPCHFMPVMPQVSVLDPLQSTSLIACQIVSDSCYKPRSQYVATPGLIMSHNVFQTFTFSASQRPNFVPFSPMTHGIPKGSWCNEPWHAMAQTVKTAFHHQAWRYVYDASVSATYFAHLCTLSLSDFVFTSYLADSSASSPK